MSHTCIYTYIIFVEWFRFIHWHAMQPLTFCIWLDTPWRTCKTIRAYIHTCTNSQAYIYILYIHTCKRANIQDNTHTHTYMHTYLHAHMHASKHIHPSTRVHKYLYLYMFIYTYAKRCICSTSIVVAIPRCVTRIFTINKWTTYTRIVTCFLVMVLHDTFVCIHQM